VDSNIFLRPGVHECGKPVQIISAGPHSFTSCSQEQEQSGGGFRWGKDGRGFLGSGES
jgi:hypothetical protein